MAKKEAGGIINDDAVVDVVRADRMRVSSPARDVVPPVGRNIHRGHSGRKPRAEALRSVVSVGRGCSINRSQRHGQP